MHDFNVYPEKPKFWVIGDARGTGSGKTTQLIDMMCFDMSKDPNYKVVLAVPTHRLGEEIAKRFIDRGFEARVFYGRNAIDPATPTHKMCVDLKRTEEINSALGDVARQACKNGAAECQFYRTCSYQAQQRLTPRVWIVAHRLLFRERPQFIPHPSFVGIDEAFWTASLNGFDKNTRLVMIDDLEKLREVPKQSKQENGKIDYGATADLKAVSDKITRILREEMSGRVRKEVLDHFSVDELRNAFRLEWRRKVEPDIKPGMPLGDVAAICQKIAEHNQEVKLVSELWELLLKTKTGGFARSPFLDLQNAIRLDKTHKRSNQPMAAGVYMVWSDDIHESWHANTWIMDATMSDKIVQRFYPQMPHSIVDLKRPSPHTHIRQITDRRISKSSFVPDEKYAIPKKLRTQRNNLERIKRVIEVQAREAWPGKLLVICQVSMEAALIGKVPENVELQHFKNHAGRNCWRDVPELMTIGRTEPGVKELEREARALFGVDITEVEPDATGAISWPLAESYIKLRDGTVVAVQTSRHPDPHVEIVRHQACESELEQALGRGRGDERTEANPLRVVILTCVPLGIEVDEALTWDEIQPPLAKVMWARGAVPLNYRDMAAAYSDLFPSAEAARKAFKRQNPGQTPINYILFISICPGFSSVAYRRPGSRGPAGRLLYDPARIDPETWLAERLGATVTPAYLTIGKEAPAAPARVADGDGMGPPPRGLPTVDVLVDGKIRRMIDFNDAPPQLPEWVH